LEEDTATISGQAYSSVSVHSYFCANWLYRKPIIVIIFVLTSCFTVHPMLKLKAIDPLLHMALDQCGHEIMGGQSSIKITTSFIPSSKLGTHYFCNFIRAWILHIIYKHKIEYQVCLIRRHISVV
jgi:hypothetical protein